MALPARNAFGGELIRHGPLTALIRLLRNLVTLFRYVFEISGHLAPSFQNVPQGTEKCFAQSNMAFEELHVIVHRCLRTTEEVNHALNYAHGNCCRGIECHDVTGGSRQRGTHLSSSVRRRLLPISLRRKR
jgi:hypothetical protein